MTTKQQQIIDALTVTTTASDPCLGELGDITLANDPVRVGTYWKNGGGFVIVYPADSEGNTTDTSAAFTAHDNVEQHIKLSIAEQLLHSPFGREYQIPPQQ